MFLRLHVFPRYVLAGTLCLALASCGKKNPELPPPPPQTMQFVAPKTMPAYSGDRAFELLVKQTSFGPRVPGSAGHAACLQYFIDFLTPLADTVTTQKFDMPGYDGERLSLTNVIARFKPEAQFRVLLAAHWDTRPRADRETNEADRARPILGANDGASGVAVLLHLAEILAASPPAIGIDIVLFDGEDYGREGDDAMYCIGSKYYAASIGSGPKPEFGILLDLVGDIEARFPQEEMSVRYAPDIVKLVWTSARTLSAGNFRVEAHDGIIDDHIALNTTAGIKTINIIDAELVGHKAAEPRRKYWHTHRDTPENCSPKTLENVGRVLLHVLLGTRPA